MMKIKNGKVVALLISAIALFGCSGNKPEYMQEIDFAMNQMWDSMRMHGASHKALELRDRVLAMPDMEQRLAAARHFARIVANENMKNGRYILREYKGDEYPRVVRCAFDALKESGGENMELCEFIFDALLRWKEACFAATSETCSDDGWDYGEKGRQHCARFLPMCYTNDLKVLERNVLVPLSLKLNRQELEYFKRRYRDVAEKDLSAALFFPIAGVCSFPSLEEASALFSAEQMNATNVWLTSQPYSDFKNHILTSRIDFTKVLPKERGRQLRI